MKTIRLRTANSAIRVIAAVVAALAALVSSAAAAAENRPANEIEKTEQLISSAWKIQEKFRNDPHRPRYHFVPPMAWMNDINGAIFWKGRYHIFYQHNPEGGYWKWMQWGHASSVDLVNWVHHPIALTPDVNGPDRKGCFSGGAFVNKEGVPTFVYHGVPDGMCLATADDDLLLHWTKHPANPVIKVPKQGQPGYGVYNVYDPTAWIYNGAYYAVNGNLQFLKNFGRQMKPGDAGDTVYLFKSSDMAHWEYVGPFYKSDRRWTEADEDNAVPDFFRLGDKWMMLFTSHLQGTQYYLGRLERSGERFVPEIYARMSWPGGALGGGRTLLDATGRRIFFDWIREFRTKQWERESGWSGAMTLPRILSLTKDGTLAIEPVPEIEVLRFNHRKREKIKLGRDSELKLDDVRGDCLELATEIEPGDAKEFGVKVRCSPDGAEQTAVVYEPAAKTLKIDMSKSTLDERIAYIYYRHRGALDRLPEEKRIVKAQEAPFELRRGETLKLRIFLDRSVLEVFANGRQCITQRIYPTRSDSVGVMLFSRGGGVNVRSVEAWDMAPANSY
ncbi:MAG TPA: glycoside hydrolase family 32 protein [Sedimentisphaerales bacterium]|nr:glycoside hydrolase family 32 protein [Sedimentisphaerales bacterium]